MTVHKRTYLLLSSNELSNKPIDQTWTGVFK